MLIFYRPFTDPYLNLAAEEYFVKHSVDDMCMIWINESAVIIGKHQNAFAEINYPYVRANHIPVVRRISGGGAVYHDAGNVNFTFIGKTGVVNKVDFGKFTSVLIQFMQSVGIEVNVNKRNSLFVGDKKFSGHAEHVFHDKILHHGTILFNTDLSVLQQCLTPDKGYESKAMESVRSDVINIAPLLPYAADIHQFIHIFVTWLLDYFPESKTYDLIPSDTKAIDELAESKYKTWEWNFGYSPAYTFQVNFKTKSGGIGATVKVENGRMILIEAIKDSFSESFKHLLKKLEGLHHREEAIQEFAKKNQQLLELAGLNSVTFTLAFFNKHLL